MTEIEAKTALREFWAAAHEKYGDAIRLGLDEEDERKLLEIEEQLGFGGNQLAVGAAPNTNAAGRSL